MNPTPISSATSTSSSPPRRGSEPSTPSSLSPSSPTQHSRRHSPPPPLDLSQIPTLSPPSPATNTLLFINLVHPDIFRPENLQSIRDLIAQTSAIHSWAPLRSFRRIVVSFWDEDAAAAVRHIWDGEAVMGERIRVYFGAPTPVEARDEHLALPDAGKLFFISPPPSPPADWEMRLEDAPNKQVHPDDLAEALARLQRKRNSSISLESPVSPAACGGGSCHDGDGNSPAVCSRSRSSTLIYMPDAHDSPGLPAISVQDMTEGVDDEEDLDPIDPPKLMTHTSRPPVELMQG